MSAVARWFCLCIALAAGEAAGLTSGGCFLLWPFAVPLAVLVALFGFGWGLRGWPLLFVAVAGFAVAGHSVEAREEIYRNKFWLRGNERYLRQLKVEEPSADGLAGIRRELSRRIGIGLEHSPESAALNRAILLGERSRIRAEVKRVFVESGTIHIFAISGLHTMIIAQVFMLILRCMMCPLRLASAAVVPLLWLYAAVIGFPPSAVRAVAMATVYFTAIILYRRPNGLLAWAQTFLLVHIISPEMLMNVGSLLSFTVMIGILGFAEYVMDGGYPVATPGWRRLVAGLFAVSLVAWVMGVPISAHVFGRITPGGLLANIVLIPAAWYSVFTGMLGVLVSFVNETAAGHFNNFSALVTGGMARVAEAVSKIPGSNFEVRAWTLWECFAWYAVIALSLWLYRSVRSRKMF